VLASFSLQEALETPLWPVLAVAFGLIVGSFANVCIYRLPRGESVVAPPSRCPRCGSGVAPWDNIPVLSYLVLRGRCRNCRAGISPRYPAVEALNALCYLGLALQFGPHLRTVVLMAFVSALIVLSLIDVDHRLLPNVITLPGIAVGLAASFLPGPPTPLSSAVGAAGGYLAFWAVAAAYRKARGVEGLGQGDWKMTAMLGAVLGWDQMLLTVFVASVAGTVVGLGLIAWRGRDRQYPLPLGTFLGLAGVVVAFVGEPVTAWYRGLLNG
jgi:leader peptidase (prepilin peptidase)/N-methyltransferase